MSLLSNSAAAAAAEAKDYTAALVGMLRGRPPIEVMRETPDAIRRAIANVDRDAMRTPELPGKWSIVQVVQHLADSELVGSFRFRMVLAHDRPALAGYDQDRWASALHYATADVEQALADFGSLRAANVRIFERTTDAERARVGVHAERGEESLGLLMQLYAGHDLVHLAQIARIKHTLGIDP